MPHCTVVSECRKLKQVGVLSYRQSGSRTVQAVAYDEIRHRSLREHTTVEGAVQVQLVIHQPELVAVGIFPRAGD